MENSYQPAGCEHKLPNGLSAWVFQSEESGSGPNMYFDVHVCVCKLCGTVRVGGFRQDSQGKLNKFSEEIDLHAAEAIDAIVKYANYIHGEEVWGRLKAQPAPRWVKGTRDFPIKKPVIAKKFISYLNKEVVGTASSATGEMICFDWGVSSVCLAIGHEVLNDLYWLDEQPAAAREGDWISVYDQLPEEGGRYWCYVQQLTDLGYSYFQWNCDYNPQLRRFSDMTLKGGHEITHWRPLAKPPVIKKEARP